MQICFAVAKASPNKSKSSDSKLKSGLENKKEKEVPHKDSSEDGHDAHREQKDEHAEHNDDDHDKEKGEHAEHGAHAESEENSQVGATKGILEVSESSGFKLAPEAEKNFEIVRKIVDVARAIEIPKSAVVTAVAEVNVYRYRNGFYKRIDFIKIKQMNSTVTIKSDDLKAGDEIVIRGLGFLRIAELAAFGGAPEGHSH